jgi:hypothetical protein
MLITYRRTGGLFALLAVAAVTLAAAVVTIAVAATLVLAAIAIAGVLLLGRAVLPRSWLDRTAPPATPWPHKTDQHALDERLAVSAVASDERHPCSAQAHVEDTGVRGIRQIEADDLALFRPKGQFGLAIDQQHVTESAHRRVGRM